MPSDKDLVRTVKAARWEDQAALDAFVKESSPASVSELRAVLALLTERALVADGGHRRRCAAFSALVEASPDERLFEPLARALKNADTTLRAALVNLLPKVNHVDHHDELCELLASHDPDHRRAASQVLRQVGGRSAFIDAADRCRDPDFPGRIEALEAFVPRARHGAIPMLAQVLASGSPQERARALSYLADAELMAKDIPGAAKVAMSALEDADDRIVGRAVDTIAALVCEQDFFELCDAQLQSTTLTIAKSVVEALRHYASPRSVEMLGRKFRAGPNSLRMDVLDSLEAIGTDDVLPVIVEALSFSQLAIRDKAAKVLSNLGRSGRVDTARTVVWLLRSRDVNVRRMAVDIARQVGDRTNALWPRMLGMLRDEDWWVRERVMDALTEIAGEQLTRHLVGLLEDPSDIVRRFAIGALNRLRDPKSLGALVRCAMNDSDWWVRELAVQSAASLNDPRILPYVLDLMGRAPDLRYVCIEAIRTLKARDAAPQVAEMLFDENADVRLAAVRCLKELDAREEVARIQSLEGDPAVRVRALAREVIELWSATTEIGSTTDTTLSYLDRLLLNVSKANADDLVLAANRTPYVKRLGRMHALGSTALTEEQVRSLLLPLLKKEQCEALERLDDVDFSYEVKSHGLRFRGHVFRQMCGVSAVFRIIKGDVPEIERLGLPPVVASLGNYKNGLVLVGGPTGSGKSTTLAAIIDHINRNSTSRHIVTIEDPIEVVHKRKGCLVNQREVGTHTKSHQAALRSILRQDPDVILVGEMRDLAMVSFAVTAAETGHLVLGTVHTVSAENTVDRLINVFPPPQQPQIRTMLAESLRAVLCQHLIPRKDIPGRALAVEVMLNTDALSNMIRKGKSFQIPSVIATSKDIGMQSMDSELMRLYRDGRIAPEEAYLRAIDKKAFETAFGWVSETKNPGGGRTVAVTLPTSIAPPGA